MSDRDTTRALVDRLRTHYLGPDTAANRMPGGVFADECGINGSMGAHDAPRNSRCDALYAGFTSASGRILVGHEVKVSLADWRKELDTVGKADTWADACHAWYIVVPLTLCEQVKATLPDGWGLMVPNPRTKARMMVQVKARVKQPHDPPWWALRSFLARADTLRANREATVEQQIRAEVVTQFEQRQAQRAEAGRLTPAESQRLALVDRLESITGLSVDGTRDTHWADRLTPEVVAAALALTRLPDPPRYSFEDVKRAALATLDGIDRYDTALAEVRARVAEDMSNPGMYTADMPDPPTSP